MQKNKQTNIMVLLTDIYVQGSQKKFFSVTCPSLSTSNFISRCSNGNNQGSFCELTCRPNQKLVGNERIQCRSNGEWSPDVEGTRCRNRIGKDD